MLPATLPTCLVYPRFLNQTAPYDVARSIWQALAGEQGQCGGRLTRRRGAGQRRLRLRIIPGHRVGQQRRRRLVGKGLHSFTSQLNLSAFHGIGGARRDCVARVNGVLRGVCGV
jgi:hypothetical protein